MEHQLLITRKTVNRLTSYLSHPIHPVSQQQDQYTTIQFQQKRSNVSNIPSEVLISELLHTQEMLLPILLRHDDRQLKD